MKFLHGADLHLDRSFEGLTQVPDSFQKYLSEANQSMLKNLVDCAIHEKVDFVLLVGDTFHQNRPTLKTQRHFFQEMGRLQAENIPVFMNFGNHDFFEAQRYWFQFPENLYLFKEETVTTKTFTTRAGTKVAISSFSYQHSHIAENKMTEFPRKQGADFQIGMYHGGQAPYAPFVLSELLEKGYDYWALGHIHQPQILAEDPAIIYPGTPLGHTQKEDQLAGIYLVEGEKKLMSRAVAIAPVVWQKKTLSLGALRRTDQLFALLQRELTVTQPTLLQLTLTDTSHLKELSYQIASGELVESLAELLPPELFVWQIQEKNIALNPPYLAVEEDLVKQLLENYRAEEIFSALIPEVSQNPQLHPFLTEDLRGAVVAQVAAEILGKYRFRGEENAD